MDPTKPVGNGPALPLLQSSSLHRVVEVDALPVLSFTSTIDLTNDLDGDDDFKCIPPKPKRERASSIDKCPAAWSVIPAKAAAKRTMKNETKFYRSDFPLVLEPTPGSEGTNMPARRHRRRTLRPMKSWPSLRRF